MKQIFLKRVLTMQSTRLVVLFTAVMAWCTHAVAQTNPYSDLKVDSHTYFKGLNDEKITALCESGSGLGTKDIFFCQKHIFEVADKELEIQYKKAVELQSMRDNDLFVKATPLLRESQKHWTLYRNKTCDYFYFGAGGGDLAHGGGTGVPAEYIDCMTDLTNQRIKELTGKMGG